MKCEISHIILILFIQGMMKSANYSEFANHKPLHEDFLAKLGGLSAPLSADTIKFAKEWYDSYSFCRVRHIP